MHSFGNQPASNGNGAALAHREGESADSGGGELQSYRKPTQPREGSIGNVHLQQGRDGGTEQNERQRSTTIAVKTIVKLRALGWFPSPKTRTVKKSAADAAASTAQAVACVSFRSGRASVVGVAAGSLSSSRAGGPPVP